MSIEQTPMPDYDDMENTSASGKRTPEELEGIEENPDVVAEDPQAKIEKDIAKKILAEEREKSEVAVEASLKNEKYLVDTASDFFREKLIDLFKTEGFAEVSKDMGLNPETQDKLMAFVIKRLDSLSKELGQRYKQITEESLREKIEDEGLDEKQAEAEYQKLFKNFEIEAGVDILGKDPLETAKKMIGEEEGFNPTATEKLSDEEEVIGDEASEVALKRDKKAIEQQNKDVAEALVEAYKEDTKNKEREPGELGFRLIAKVLAEKIPGLKEGFKDDSMSVERGIKDIEMAIKRGEITREEADLLQQKIAESL